MAGVILLDVNETLLDLGALDPSFERAFGRPDAREAWFQQLKENWLVADLTGRYADFGALAGAALAMVAEREGVALGAGDRSAILDQIARLSAHPEAADALDLLAGAGLRLAALTNGTGPTARAQLRHAGLADRLEAILSADDVRRYKPAAEPYRMAARRLGVEPGDIRMVAAHAWDLAGAAAAGCATAFVARPRQVLNPAAPMPDLAADDLLELARRIVRADGRA